MSYKRDHYLASKPQFLFAALACVLTIVVAFRIPKPSRAQTSGPVPPAWVVALGSLILCSAFKVVPNRWGWWAVAAYLLLFLLAIGAVSVWSRRPAWQGSHRLALAVGATLAYAWHSFLENPVVSAKGLSPLVSHVVFTLVAVGILGIAARSHQLRRSVRWLFPQTDPPRGHFEPASGLAFVTRLTYDHPEPAAGVPFPTLCS